MADADTTSDDLDRLLPVDTKHIGADLVPTISARDLHGQLGVGRDFSNWIKGRIAEYGFAEGLDFTTQSCSPNLASKKWGGANAKE